MKVRQMNGTGLYIYKETIRNQVQFEMVHIRIRSVVAVREPVG